MKKKYAKKADVPKELAAHYEPVDSAQPDGAQVRIDEDEDEASAQQDESAEEKRSFRERNVFLQKQLAATEKRLTGLEATLKKFEGLDIDTAKKGIQLINSQQSEEERKLLAEGKIDDVLERRTSAMKSHFENQMKSKEQSFAELEGKYKDLSARYTTQLASSALTSALDDTGIKLRRGARTDAEKRFAETFKPNDKGQLEAHDDDGPKFSKNGKPYTPKDFVMDLVEQAPFLVETTGGGGGIQTATGRSSAKGGNQGGVVVLDRNDPEALGRHADALAKGQVKFTS